MSLQQPKQNFSTHLASTRYVVLCRKTTGTLLPIALTAIGFLFVYNNTHYGKLILAALIGVNLFLLVWPETKLSQLVDPLAMRLTSLYIAIILGVWICLELIFPHLFPSDYTQLMELTKSIRGSGSMVPSVGATVFENEDQQISFKKNRDVGNSETPVSWHRPGERFQYQGYDPNSGMIYVNRFFWNSHGYFDHDRPRAKPPDVKRIIFIGDSYVEAIQVPLKLTFHKRLEASLNTKTPADSGPEFQVIALGNSGAGQAAHLQVLKKEALAYQPDVVILMLCSNDFCDDDPILKHELILVAGEFGSFTRGLARHGLMAATFVIRRVESVWRSRISVSPELLQWSAKEIPRVEKAWLKTLDYIDEARLLCEKAGIAFILVYLGSDIEVKYALAPENAVNALRSMGGAHAEMSWEMNKSVARVENYCAQHGIKLISLLGPLAQAQARAGKRVFGDHYTMFGHEVVGQVLTCVIEKYLRQGIDQDFHACLDIDPGR